MWIGNSRTSAGEFKLSNTGQIVCYDERNKLLDCTGTSQDHDSNIMPNIEIDILATFRLPGEYGMSYEII